MGVYSKEYVILGYDLLVAVKKMDNDQFDKFQDEMETFADSNGLEFIYDGMSGEYCFLGHVLNKSNSGEGMPIVKHWISDLDKLQHEILGKVMELKIIQYPTLYSFTHWY